jgi:DNA-binding transcriptional LysR family regulator
MNLSIRHLRAFVAVAEAGSFTGAAQTIGLSQPAVTATIRQLEEELSADLFTRTTRQVRLSEDGVAFLETARRLIGEFDNAISDMKEATAQGALRLSLAVLPSIAVLLLPQIVETLVNESPQFDIHIRDLNSSAIQRRVRSGEVDVGIGTYAGPDRELMFTPLFTDCLGMVCGTNHPLACTTGPVAWDELTSATFLNLATDTGIRPLIEAAGGLPDTRGGRLEFSNVLTLASILERNIGVTAMPYLTFLSLHRSGLCFRPLNGAAIERTVSAMTRKGTSTTPAVRRLLHLFSQQVEELLQNPEHAPFARPA